MHSMSCINRFHDVERFQTQPAAEQTAIADLQDRGERHGETNSWYLSGTRQTVCAFDIMSQYYWEMIYERASAYTSERM